VDTFELAPGKAAANEERTQTLFLPFGEDGHGPEASAGTR
jgi:hypothetical protein